MKEESELFESVLAVVKLLFKDGGDLMTLLENIMDHIHGIMYIDRVSIWCCCFYRR